MDADHAVERLTRSIEDFNSVFIRLPGTDRLSFSALSVLHTLSRRGPCRLSELVRTEQIKQPALTAAVSKLERDRLLVRGPDPSDGRAVLLSLTDIGRQLVVGRHTERADRLRALIDQLPAGRRKRLLGIAGVLDDIVSLADQQRPTDRQDPDHRQDLDDERTRP
ncbi:MarR family transcriptional regulator [Nakamurella sp. A5-74]|uniref:MarR family transcriptional regulator n=1 Tax=Nakamurella sp. A5-74 TaxID=3158264 RepID=A0AAU8DTL0_9ACTN